MPIICVYGESEHDLDFMVYKGNQYIQLGEIETAISIFENVLKNDEKNVLAIIELGNLNLLLENYDLATSNFKKALDIEPNNLSALNGLKKTLHESTSYKFGLLNGSLELDVHDSQGGLVAFQRIPNMLVMDHQITNGLIETWPVVKVITHDNQNFALHQQKFVQVVQRDTIIGFHQVHFAENVDLPLISTWFYQIPVEKGDIVTYVYSIFLPLQ